MFRRATTAIAASAIVLAGLTFSAAPASAAVTGGTLTPSSWALGSSPEAVVTMTYNAAANTTSPFVIVDWDWSTNNWPANGQTQTVTPGTNSFTCDGTGITFASDVAWATAAGTVVCTFATAGPNPGTRQVTLSNARAAANANLTVTFPAGSVTAGASSTMVGIWTLPDSVQVRASVTTDSTTPAPIVTIDIDPNGGVCEIAKVTGFYSTWANAPRNCSKTGSIFKGFNTNAGASDASIAPGGNLHLTGDNRIYAIYDTPRTAGAPTDVTAVAGTNQVTVSWKAPADAGTFPITNYLAQANPSGRVCITRTSDANMLTCTFNLPATNTKYAFTVQALNGVGWGPKSAASAAVSPYDFRDITASRPNILLGLGGSRVEVSGSAPGLAGKAVNAQYKVGDAKDWTTQANAATVNAQGKFNWSRKFGPRENGKNVSVRFTYGTDLVSGTYVLSRGGEAGNLTAPRNLKIENVVNRVKVTWDAPRFNGGEKIIGYTICANGAGSLCRNVSAEGQGDFQNLATGREYTITVAARTATRTGPAAEAKQKVSPVEASVRIASRDDERIGVTSRVAGFKAGAKFRLEYAVAVPGEPASTWRWVAFPNVIADGNVDRSFLLPPADVDAIIAVRLVTPSGPVYSRVSRP